MKDEKNIVRWLSRIDGKEYNFFYERFKNKNILHVNNQQVFIKENFFAQIFGFEQKVNFDGIDGYFVVQKYGPDIAYDGVCLRSHEEFTPQPKWSVLFAVMCMLIPIVTMGGALPAALGFGGAWLSLKVSRAKFPLALKIIACIGITILCWFLVMVGVSFFYAL